MNPASMERDQMTPIQKNPPRNAVCGRCGNVLFGTALTCVVHGDQRDVGGAAAALETVADQRKRRRDASSEEATHDASP